MHADCVLIHESITLTVRGGADGSPVLRSSQAPTNGTEQRNESTGSPRDSFVFTRRDNSL